MTRPTVLVDVGFTATTTGDYWHIGDETRGKIGTAAIGPDQLWTDVSSDAREVTIRRDSSRAGGPVIQYDAGKLTVRFRNETRAYDPTNLDGPHVAGGVTQVTPMRPARVRAAHLGVTYDLIRAFADSWKVGFVSGTYSETQLLATDGTKVLAAVDRAASAAVGAGEDTGARIDRILTSAGWPTADRMIATGDSTVQATTLSGTALSEAQTAAEAEAGEFYFDAAGRAYFRNRRAILADARSTTPQAIFGNGWVRSTNLALDAFGRTASSSLGSADTGQAWTTAGGSGSDYNVADGSASITLGTVNVSRRATLAVTGVDEVTCTMWVDAVATGAPIRSAVMLRVLTSASDHYRVQLNFELAGTLTLSLVVRAGGTDTTLASATVPFTYAAGTRIRVRGQVDGTTLRGMAYLADDPQPVRWLVEETDATYAAGPPGLRMLLATGNTNGTVTVRVDDWQAGTAGGLIELPYQDVVVDYDDTQLYNVARISRDGGSEQTVTNAASVAAYLTHTYPRSGLPLETDAEALNYAGWVVYQSKDPELRFSQITIRPGNSDSDVEDLLYLQVLTRQIGDRITVIVRPAGGGDPIERDVFIRGIQHRILPGLDWETTWTLQSATKYAFWTIGDPILGRIGFNAIAY